MLKYNPLAPCLELAVLEQMQYLVLERAGLHQG
jgi:hypothetical protein